MEAARHIEALYPKRYTVSFESKVPIAIEYLAGPSR